MKNMTIKLAAAVKSLESTAPGVGYNIWDIDGTKTEIRPQSFNSCRFNITGEHNGPISSLVALALVREAACRGNEIMLWLCCACDTKDKSIALGSFVSHGYCAPCAARLRAEALAFATSK